MVKKQPQKKKKTPIVKPSSKHQPIAPLSSSSVPLITPSILSGHGHQQRLLNIFASAFNNVIFSKEFPFVLQEIKQALFDRDFATAFGKGDYLEAYAARWSPTRTLCYSEVFSRIQQFLSEVSIPAEHRPQGDDECQKQLGNGQHHLQDPSPEGVMEVEAPTAPPTSDVSSAGRRRTLNMVSVGGCAAEHLAFASYLHTSNHNGRLTLLDSAPWLNITSLLEEHIGSPPQLSRYASAAAREANKPFLLPSRLSTVFIQQDVLDLDLARLMELLGISPLIVTMLFTLNELYAVGGIARTTKFLKMLGEALPGKSILLVVDSPGSYSETVIGSEREKKRYPMQWLLDHTLVGTEACGYVWERLEADGSLWFRIPEELSYPIPLENMRYQMHLYRIRRTSPQ